MFDMNSQNLEGLWRVEGLKEGSVAHRSGVLFQGNLIKSIQEWEVTGQGWESFGCVYANLFVRVYVHTRVVCISVHVCAFLRACACACVRAFVCVGVLSLSLSVSVCVSASVYRVCLSFCLFAYIRMFR